MSLTIRQATADDIAKAKLPLRPTMKALVAEVDGAIIGFAGLGVIAGRYYAFCDLTSEQAKPYRYRIARAAQRFLTEARQAGIRFIYTRTNPNEPGATRWLLSLGFRSAPLHPDLYRWSSELTWPS
jgi:N-acetylglutamate synthase-like GNAT family acetyltransferase